MVLVDDVHHVELLQMIEFESGCIRSFRVFMISNTHSYTSYTFTPPPCEAQTSHDNHHIHFHTSSSRVTFILLGFTLRHPTTQATGIGSVGALIVLNRA